MTFFKMETLIKEEIAMNYADSYQLGSYLYLGMANKNQKKVCIAVAYRLNYCIKKIDEFLALDPEIDFLHISKIKIGETKACQKFKPSNPLNTYYK